MKKVLKWIAFSIFAAVALLGCTLWYLYASADMQQPEIEVDLADYPLCDSAAYRTCNGNYLRQNSYGLWEEYLHGKDIDRGVASGVLSKELLRYQEQVFVDQIREFIPSDRYLSFLRFFTIIFNRNLGRYIPEEYRNEIYGISLSCSHDYDRIGTPYQRQLNYHAAHDIGHTMQEYMLVGCSSFAVWGDRAADSTLTIGRNFDFYVGDGFAKNKLVLFVAPESGYKFVSVGWAGMIGVLSGMNEKGLTVTINAAKGAMPTSAAMPISLLAREILQYAATIDEAYAIARSRHTFVSESLLIGSAQDAQAAIIEKTPEKIALKRGASNRVVCTNHYQSAAFEQDSHNLENLKYSDSPYRFSRLEELLSQHAQLSTTDVAAILRDHKGVGGSDVGLANEMTINQSIAHHSVIFKPQQGLMWVSTTPWQSGAYICYDLNRVFADTRPTAEVTLPHLTIPADSLFLRYSYPDIVKYRALAKEIKAAISHKKRLDDKLIDQFIASNPHLYHVYELSGDYYCASGEVQRAKQLWRKALEQALPTETIRQSITKKLTHS